MKMIFAGAAAIAIAGAAMAAEQYDDKGMMGEPTSRAEVSAKVAEHFGKLDADKDGYVTDAEMKAMRDQHRAKMEERRGQRAEKREERRGDMFDKLDTDKNGSISRDEFAKAGEMRDRRMAMRGHMMRRAMGDRMRGRMLENADADNDGRISLQEMQAKALARFDEMDANRDGTVTREERRDMHMKMREERREKRQQQSS